MVILIIMRVEGFEPSATVWKTVNLTINRYSLILYEILKKTYYFLNISYKILLIFYLKLPINFSKNDILCTNNGNNICNHMASSHKI